MLVRVISWIGFRAFALSAGEAPAIPVTAILVPA